MKVNNEVELGVIPELEGVEDVVCVRWSDEEVASLCRYYGKVKNPTLAKALGKSIGAVTQKAYRLGLTKRG